MTKSSSSKAYHLLEFDCEEKQDLILLDNATYSIGRDPDSSIIVNSTSISRQHAILLRVTMPDSDQHLFRVIDGSLTGKRSTNGVYVNAKKQTSCILKHGDEIVFGGRVRATYYNFYAPAGLSNSADVKRAFTDSQDDEAAFSTVVVSLDDSKDSADSSLLHLATFPELIPHPIVEISTGGAITYLNPKAVASFPDIREKATDHFILKGIIKALKDANKNSFVRVIEHQDYFFEESVHYIRESDLVRIFISDITDQKKAEIAHLKAEEKYRNIFLNSVEGIFQTTLEGRYLIANPRLAIIYGYDSPENLISRIDNIGNQLYVNPKRRQEFVNRILAEGCIFDFESQIYRRDGSTIWISENARAICDANGQCIGFEGAVQDITEKKTAEAELIKRDSLLQAVAQAANCLLVNLDFQAAILSALSIIGNAIAVDALFIGKQTEGVDAEDCRVKIEFFWSQSREQPTQTRFWQHQSYAEVGIRRWFDQLAAGETVAGSLSTLPESEQQFLQTYGVQSFFFAPLTSAGQLWGFLGAVDCQQLRQWSSHEGSTLLTIAANMGAAIHRQEIEDAIRHRALHDGLTGLPNRLLFDEQLDFCLNNARRTQNFPVVMFLDLDRFKAINDTLGHTIGDRLLKQVALRLIQAVRSGDVVARWGGDEFIILLPTVKSSQDVDHVAERILSVLDAVFEIEGHELYVTTSIGIAFGEDRTDAETLIKRADIALYQAKELGRNGYQIYTPLMDSRTPEILVLEKDLRHALDRNELYAVYQPRVNILTKEIDSMEALLRWHHPHMGLVSPGTFIPIAEENGLIISIGEWILREACAQNKRWQEAGLPPIRVSVNLSPKQFRQSNLVQKIADILSETGLAPEYLELEVTETTAIHDIDFTGEVFRRLGAMGVQLSIDDFGTGHSSLSRLQFLPLNHLKIDKSFVQDLTTNQKVSHIISTIVALGKSLGLSIVAEGVETEQQLDFLKSIDCETAQGFFFYRPVCMEEATRLLERVAHPVS